MRKIKRAAWKGTAQGEASCPCGRSAPPPLLLDPTTNPRAWTGLPPQPISPHALSPLCDGDDWGYRRRRPTLGAEVFVTPIAGNEHPPGIPPIFFPSCCQKPSTQTLRQLFGFLIDALPSFFFFFLQKLYGVHVQNHVLLLDPPLLSRPDGIWFDMVGFLGMLESQARPCRAPTFVAGPVDLCMCRYDLLRKLLFCHWR